jgi:uncharacterized protein (UPF0332 family)
MDSLAGTQSEFDSERFNNSANRAYYAAFQAAISAMLRHGIRRADGKWPHTFVQSEFNGKLIKRQRRYPSRLRETLAKLQLLRHRADYQGATISRSDARLALRLSGELLDAVEHGGESP